MTRPRPAEAAGYSRGVLAAYFAGLMLAWGLAFGAIKVGLAACPPLLYAGLRTLGGGAALSLWAWWRREPLRLREEGTVYVVSSLLNVIVFFGLQTVTIQLLPSGLASVLVYFQPIAVGVIAWIWLREPMTVTKAIGLGLGFLGMVAASGQALALRHAGDGVAVGLLSAVTWAAGTVYVKAVQDRVSAVWLMAVQFTLGGLVLTPLALLVDRGQPVVWSWTLVGSLAYASLAGVAFAWIAWYAIIRVFPATEASAYIFGVPLVSVLTGVVALGEPFTPELAVGLVATALGIFLVNRAAPRRPAEAGEGRREARARPPGEG
ncbi:MAG: DMT family transporter [Actinomycetia bacterium]|nr:DMT family transporter [Actinomycetes bacterium]